MGFFESFTTEADHWLPPDNVQEHPALMVAHRTSPTNIGLALLADLAAYDFGYISSGALGVRTANVCARWSPWHVIAATTTTGTTR